METLRCNNHQAFPVTPDVRRAFDNAEPFDLHGVILRADILKLIMHGVGFFELEASGEIPPSRCHIPPTQKVPFSPASKDLAQSGGVVQPRLKPAKTRNGAGAAILYRAVQAILAADYSPLVSFVLLLAAAKAWLHLFRSECPCWRSLSTGR